MYRLYLYRTIISYCATVSRSHLLQLVSGPYLVSPELQWSMVIQVHCWNSNANFDERKLGVYEEYFFHFTNFHSRCFHSLTEANFYITRDHHTWPQSVIVTAIAMNKVTAQNWSNHKNTLIWITNFLLNVAHFDHLLHFIWWSSCVPPSTLSPLPISKPPSPTIRYPSNIASKHE